MKRANILPGLVLAALFIFGFLNSPALAATGKSGITAVPVEYTVSLESKDVSLWAYEIDGGVYFKLRDLAAALSGTNKEFSVTWDGKNHAVEVALSEAYAAVGDELSAPSGDSAGGYALASPYSLSVDGLSRAFTTYLIGGYSYFKISDIGDALNFQVSSDAAARRLTIDAIPADSVMLYELSDDYFTLSLSEIPYYQNGYIQFKQASFFDQYKADGAVAVVSAVCANLIGSDWDELSADENNISSRTATELKAKNGVDIKEVEAGRVELTVPGLGRYSITLEAPAGTDVPFIRKIVFHPDLTDAQASGTMLLYCLDDQLNLKTPPKTLPDYEYGHIVPENLLSYDEWIAAGGHQGWQLDPFLLTQTTISNLVPENIVSWKNWFQSDWTRAAATATSVGGVKISLLSPNDASLDNPSNADTLTYSVEVPSLGVYAVTVSRPYGSAFYRVTKITLTAASAESGAAIDGIAVRTKKTVLCLCSTSGLLRARIWRNMSTPCPAAGR